MWEGGGEEMWRGKVNQDGHGGKVEVESFVWNNLKKKLLNNDEDTDDITRTTFKALSKL